MKQQTMNLLTYVLVETPTVVQTPNTHV